MSMCKDCNIIRVKSYSSYNPKIEEEVSLSRRLKRHHIDELKYKEILFSQNGICPICNKREAKVIDHDHSCCDTTYSCGKCIRGIICSQCNQALGLLCDDVSILRNAIKYLDA